MIDHVLIFVSLPCQDAFASERRKAKMLNFSIAYEKTPVGHGKIYLKAAKNYLEKKTNETYAEFLCLLQVLFNFQMMHL